jgi:hypothetical protein
MKTKVARPEIGTKRKGRMSVIRQMFSPQSSTAKTIFTAKTLRRQGRQKTKMFEKNYEPGLFCLSWRLCVLAVNIYSRF